MIRAFLIGFSLFLSSALSGCGFTPLHQAVGSSAPLANINVDMLKGPSVVDNQAGFFVTQRLRERIGTQSEDAKYRLKITPNYRRSRLGITDADVASRYDIRVSASWDLVDAKTGKSLKKGRTSSVTAFGAPDGPYGVITADNVGVEQAAGETADKLIVELARHFAADAK